MRRRVLLTAICFCILSGCVEAPENTNEENGVIYDLGEQNENITDILEEDMEKIRDADQEREYSYQCDIGNSENRMRIDAVIHDAGKKNISSMTAIISSDMVNKAAVIEALFDNGDTVTESNQKESYNEVSQEYDNPVTVGMEAMEYFKLENQNKSVSFSCSNGGIYYSNDELLSQYQQMESRGGVYEETGKDISENYTVNNAKTEVMDLFHEILNQDIYIISCTSIYNEEGNGYYAFVFAPIIDGMPVMTNDWGMNTDNIVDVYGEIQIGEDGIASIQADNFLWKVLENEQMEICITFEQAIKILQEYISTGEIPVSNEIIFSRAALSWIPRTDDWKTAEMTPVWRFYIPLPEMVQTGMIETSMMQGIPTNICINAVNGEIEYIE